MNTIIIILVLSIPIIAKIKISFNCKKYAHQNNSKKLSGCEIAHLILEENGLKNTYVVESKISRSQYDNSRKVLRLSTDSYNQESITSLAITALECTHAIEIQNSSSYVKFKNLFLPITKVASLISYVIILVALITSSYEIIDIGFASLFLILIFYVITFPLEKKISLNCLKLLNNMKLINKKEEELVGEVLQSLALRNISGVIFDFIDDIKKIIENGFNR